MTVENMPENEDTLNPLIERKRELRRVFGAARRARGESERERVSEQLLAQLQNLPEFDELLALPAAGSIAAYVSFAGEPGTAHIRQFAATQGLRVAMPIIRPDYILDWAWDTVETAPGRNYVGVPEPTGEVVAHGADGIVSLHCRIMLVPALAADSRGLRMGKGGGFYDRLLADLETREARPLLVAVVHDDEVVDELPVEDHDHPVDAVLTPTRIIRIPGRRDYIPLV
jgi:5-formyltetrahydrofolate cyclo-ligase